MRRRKPIRRVSLPSMKELRRKEESGFFSQQKNLQKLEELKQRVSEETKQVFEKAKETVEEVKEIIEEAKEEIKEEVSEVKETAEKSLEELSKEELIVKAKELGISVRKNWSVKTLINKIESV